jgi:hypothetical protein
MTSYCKILLSSGDITIVDDIDYPLIAQYGWYLFQSLNSKTLKYARAKVNGQDQYLHRILLKPPRHLDVDHKNGDGLDNRRGNLRICTESQNLGGRKINVNNTSGYRGGELNATTHSD